MRVHYFQHVPFEDLSLIENWVSERKFSLSVTSFFKDNYQIPRTEDFDLLIVLGGPMSVHDQDIYPWLVKEKECIKKSIDEGKQVLGICLGAQLMSYGKIWCTANQAASCSTFIPSLNSTPSMTSANRL